MTGKKITLAAISPDSVKKHHKFAKGEDIKYHLLSDVKLEATKGYGVLMKDSKIPVPSVFVISPDGKVRWKYIGKSITDRANMWEMIRQAEKYPAPKKQEKELDPLIPDNKF